MVLILLLFSSCNGKIRHAPLPVNGVMDLRDWNFRKDGTVKLSGYWQFYYEDFLTAAQFDTIKVHHYVWAHGAWKGEICEQHYDTDRVEKKTRNWLPESLMGYTWKGKPTGCCGYASYRLRLLLPKGRNDLKNYFSR